MKTLTSIGIQKIGQRFVDSVDHADYTLNGVPQTAEPFRRFVQGASARVYIYFDDTVIGDVAEVQLVDKDGDIIASAVLMDQISGLLPPNAPRQRDSLQI